MSFRVTARGRWFALAMLMLVATSTAVGSTSVTGVHAQEESATLTIHNRTCPAGYDDGQYFRDCHDLVGSATTFHLFGPTRAKRSSGPDGNISFDYLFPGQYSLFSDVPDDDVAYWFFCAESAAPGVAIPFDVNGSGASAGIGIFLDAGDDVVCDWYNTPATVEVAPDGTSTTASMTTVYINAWGCPRAYPRRIDFAACVTPWVGQHLRFANRLPGDTWKTVTTDTTGSAIINLTYHTDPYHVTMDLPSYVGWYEMICANHQGQPLNVSYDRVGVWLYGLAGSTDVVCDLYLIPAPFADDEPRG